MGGKLHSLTDVLKKTLFFFDSLTISELTHYVHKQMLEDYKVEEVRKKVRLCLEQHQCFNSADGDTWTLNLEGKRENEGFYNLLLKKQKPLNFKELANAHKKKKNKPLAEQAALIGDGRFIQLENGNWGLTEWEVDAGDYALKHLIIKVLSAHPTGLSINQLTSAVSVWRKTEPDVLLGVLSKFPYFETIGNDVWYYNPGAKVVYDQILKKYLVTLMRQREKWQREREVWHNKIRVLQIQLTEVTAAHREAAAALALRRNEINRVEQMTTQMAEKDLLLALRKKEIYRYREHIQKLEAKANSILYQCRLWVQRAKENESEKNKLQAALNRTQSSLESMFTKFQQYKERERENKARVMEMKEKHGERIAELQTEIVNLKQKLEKVQDNKDREIKIWRDETNTLSTDLKCTMDESERLNRALRMSQQELQKIKNEYKTLEKNLAHPLIKLLLKITARFKKTPQQTV